MLVTTWAAAAAPLETEWGSEPLERISPTREQICLNGVWLFSPAVGSSLQNPPKSETGWGRIRVPGSWLESSWPRSLGAELMAGKGDQWSEGLQADKTISRAWFQRPLDIPSSWTGKRIALRFFGLGTDASVFVDGNEVGQVSYPGGEIDITNAVRSGSKSTLTVRVVTTGPETVAVLMGYADDGKKVANDIVARGILDDVFLEATPRGVRIDNVRIRTSFRNKSLEIEGDLAGTDGGGPWTVTAAILDENGKTIQRFTEAAAVPPGAESLRAKWAWDKPVLWSPESPTLLALALEVRDASGKVVDDFRESFGFREFWIDGRDFYLNGVKTRLRPAIHGTPTHVGVREVIDAYIDAYQQMGSNFVEMWPDDPEARTIMVYSRQFAKQASRKGLLMSAVAPHLNAIVQNATETELTDEAKQQFIEEATKRMLHDAGIINEPSVVLWGSSGNAFSPGYASGPIAPQNIGRLTIEDYPTGKSEGMNQTRARLGQSLVDLMKKIDPTRPIYTHHGGAVGDFPTQNMYLNLIPLQEREEWFSAWAQGGKRPYMVVEHGDPLSLTFLRGRSGFGNSIGSEAFPTEYVAAYFGPESYAQECDEFRTQLVKKFRGDQKYDGWWDASPILHGDNYQHLLSLFVKNTNRAWRTWGNSGGTISWELHDSGWATKEGEVPLPAFKPGTRGPYASVLATGLFRPFVQESQPILPAGKAHVETNQPVLAYIGGFDASNEGHGNGFAEKTHNFRGGSKLAKQIVLINDTETQQPFSAKWATAVSAQKVSNGSAEGSLAPGEIRFERFEVALPEISNGKADGAISLNARIGDVEQKDEFVFRVFAPVTPKVSDPVSLYDPAGDTARMLKNLGILTKPWEPGQVQKPNGLLVVGRHALEGQKNLPADIQEFIEQGGRCIVMAQDPHWLRENFGFRVSWHLSRRAFPVIQNHPALDGLDAEDLRDWSGSSTLVKSHPEWQKRGEGDPAVWNMEKPYAGWRWGNRGALSSAAIETPHHGGWTPVLACEFDMAYSPLIEKSIGDGWLALCFLDLEDQVDPDPAARRLAVQFFDYARSLKPQPALPTIGIGLGPWTKQLEGMGLVFSDASQLPSESALAIIGAEAKVTKEQLDAFLQLGGRAFVLPGSEKESSLGIQLRRKARFGGSSNVPDWPEARGLSVSDLRLRADISWPLLAGGCEIGADGLLGIRREGKGVAVFSQLDPAALDADKKTYFRFSRWRQTRAIGQLLGNLGARFNSDLILARGHGHSEIPLNKGWRAHLTQRHDAPGRFADRIQDPGITEAARSAVAPSFDDSDWKQVRAPRAWEDYGGEWFNADGEAVFRVELDIPANWEGRALEIGLGKIHAFDEIFWNGQSIGKTGTDVKDAHFVNRRYTVPANSVHAGKNHLAVRIYNDWSDGGFRGGAEDMFIRPARSGGGFYHVDYRDDFDFGDDPFRYYNW